eukprot:gnl/TRDRNA2_/TRDRNA2_147264_c1_seq1.p1 gnl/TRDRNA2_/TRDRNA2_147264_c1~~gnl/TRDRNA2_/TRDRNA2_147264_c1_seq1.p1  ORF type:complete len:241 (-),score=47.53 gnl/TRDRNA2_/TRDRNA2_147264_c1_seq1:178-792(-)
MYILAVAYSMTSLITGVISESLMAARQEDDKIKMQELEESRLGLLQGLKQVLKQLDQDNSGTITRNEISAVIKDHPEVLTQLAMFDVVLEEEDFMALFDKIARVKPPHDELEIDDFVDALSSLTGTAKAAALFDLKTDIADQNAKSSERESLARDRSEQLRDSVASLRADFDSDIAAVRGRIDGLDARLGVLVELLAKRNGRQA